LLKLIGVGRRRDDQESGQSITVAGKLPRDALNYGAEIIDLRVAFVIPRRVPICPVASQDADFSIIFKAQHDV
jgi:hypothetical protein